MAFRFRHRSCAKCGEPAEFRNFGTHLCFNCASITANFSAARFHEWFVSSLDSGTSIAVKRLRTEGARIRQAFGGAR